MTIELSEIAEHFAVPVVDTTDQSGRGTDVSLKYFLG
jgi:hypothetical protein